MTLVRIDRNPSRLQLNVFGAIWLVFFAAAAVMARYAGSPAVAIGLGAAAVIVPVAGWALPRFMRLAYLGMAYLAYPIGLVLSHLLLAAVYYLVFTPMALLMRVCRYDPMKRCFQPEAESYWVPREEPERVDVDRYFRQF